MGPSKIFYAGIFFFALFPSMAKAQLYIGLEGGATKNYLQTNVSNLVSTQYNPAYGFYAGIPVLYQITEWLAVQADPGYFQKNYQLQRTGFLQGVYQDNSNSYIQLPLMGNLSFGGRQLRGFINLGGYGAYWVTSHLKGRMPNILDQPAFTNSMSNAQPNSVFDEFTPYNYSEKYQFSTTKDNRMEFGVLAGLGISYEMQEKYRFFIESRYYRSLTDQQKNYQMGHVPLYNEAVSFGAGCVVKIFLRKGNLPYK